MRELQNAVSKTWVMPITLAVLVLSLALTPAGAQFPPADEDALAEDETELRGGETSYEVMRRSIDELNEIAERPLPPEVGLLLPAVQKVRDALARFERPNAKLPDVLRRLGAAVRQLDRAAAQIPDVPTRDEIRAIQAELVDVARGFAIARIASAASTVGFGQKRLERATARLARADRFDLDDNPGKAIGGYSGALKFADAGLVFDVDVFEQNIRATFDGSTVGYAYAINRFGKLARANAVGLARTAADGQTAQSQFKRMNIASLTKTMTATAVLKLIAERDNVTVDSPIAPWLPADWVRGPNINTLTFRQLLTHVSGLGGRDAANQLADCGTSFNALRACVANGVFPADQQDYNYNNGNYGLFRIIIPYMSMFGSPIGQHCNNHPACPTATADSTMTTYRFYMQCAIFRPMGLSGEINPFDGDPFDCPGPDLFPTDPNPTLWYGLPGEDVSGLAEGDWRPVAGGGGWYFSAFEVARFLAHLRYNTQILPKAAREQMYSDFLGWNDPDAFAARVVGVRGLYRSHGGFLQYGPPFNGRQNTQYHSSCMMDFPGEVQAVILSNGLIPAPERCVRLKNAYEAAWVAK